MDKRVHLEYNISARCHFHTINEEEFENAKQLISTLNT